MGSTKTDELRTNDTAAAPSYEQKADTVELVDVLLSLARRRQVIAKVTIGTALLSLIITLLVPNLYEATTIMMPPQQSQGAASALLGQLAPLAALAGKDVGVATPSAAYVSILKSRTVQDALIKRFDLVKHYDKKRWSDVRKKLEDRTLVSEDRKSGVITINVEDEDPQRAANIANSYVDELHAQTQRLAITEAGRRRLFFEQEVEEEKGALIAAEENLRRTQEKTGLIQLDAQAKGIIDSVARLKSQIAAKEVQLHAMQSYATYQNPDYILVRQELAGLKTQLAEMEGKEAVTKGDLNVPTSRVPEEGLEYVRRLRDVKYHEMLFETLAKQYEAAKIDEAKDAAIIQVIDYAVPADHKSGPHRVRIVLLATVAMFLLVCIFVGWYDNREERQLSASQLAKLETLRGQIFWRS